MNKQTLIISYYTSHRSELLAFVGSRLGGATEEAEDIVQDVFLHLLTSDRMITAVTLPALVYTAARHRVTDYYRRRNSHEAYGHYLRDTGGTGSSAESLLNIREMTEQLERGLARVPERCREIYRMHVYGGMKAGEISRRLGEGYKSVEHRLGAARKAVRTALRRYA